MHSELLRIGGITLHSYGLCMALGFLFAWQVAVWLCKRSGRNADQLTSLITGMMIASIGGARVAYVIEHWQVEFADNPSAILRIDQGGLMFYGGFIAAALFVLIFIKLKKIKFFEVSDILLSVLPLGHAFGRIGCFMHGCCYGRITSEALGVHFPAHSPAWIEQCNANPPLIEPTAAQSLPVIPTQLIESGANLLIFAAMIYIFLNHYRKLGLPSAIYLIAYAFMRFMVEFLRGDPRANVGALSISQTISIGLAAIGVAILLNRRKEIFDPEN
jgi:phosphatidylglycerol---prolipoprotein diacylglyceryl transferase